MFKNSARIFISLFAIIVSSFFVYSLSFGASLVITPPERELVIKKVADILCHKVGYVDGDPHLVDMKLTSELWNALMLQPIPEELLESGDSIYTNASFAQTTPLRQDFLQYTNSVLGQMFSGIALVKQADCLAERLRIFPNVDFKFTEAKAKSMYQKYTVTEVDSDSDAYRQGVRVGQKFCLPTRKEDIKKYGLGPCYYRKEDQGGSIVEEGWDLLFFRENPNKPPIHFGAKSESGEEYVLRGQYEYEPDHTREEELEALGVDPLTAPIVIKSFRDEWSVDPADLETGEYYDGCKFAGAVEFMKRMGADKLVLDLRGTAGTSELNIRHFLSHFVPTGIPYGFKIDRSALNSFLAEKSNRKKFLKCGDRLGASFTDAIIKSLNKTRPELTLFHEFNNPQFMGHVEIHLDRASGHGAEFVAGALKLALGSRCTTIGPQGRSAGCGLVTSFDPDDILDGYCVMYPIEHTLLGTRYSIEGKGIPVDALPGGSLGFSLSAGGLSDGTYGSLLDKHPGLPELLSH